MAALHNRINREELKKRLMEEPFARRTVSFYRYVIIEDPQMFRNQLFEAWQQLGCFGRIYVAREGINAQMSIPQENVAQFLAELDTTKGLEQMPLKWAVEDDGKSFYKLTIKVRPKIVADGLDDGTFDVTNVGRHLSPEEWHELLEEPDTVVIDMRNHYETEIGHFKGAICPEADNFREEIQMVEEEFYNQKDKKLLLYCTGGVRCEKASAYLKHKGFKDVNQLHGGIIAYAQQIKAKGLKSKFVGHNFVFDERMAESIDNQVISKCHQCGTPTANHINCANAGCHLLFLQCEACAQQYNHCCSAECKDFIELPLEVQKQLRKTTVFNGSLNSKNHARKNILTPTA